MINSFLFSIVLIGYLFFVIYCIATPLITLFRKEKACRSAFSGGALIFSEIIYTVIGPVIGFIRFDEFRPDIPFSKPHVLIIILMVITSSLSFWIAKLTVNTPNPVVRILISVGLLQGLVLCAITTIHFIPFIPNGIMFPVLGFELLSPLIAFVLLLREFYFFNRMEINLNELLPYRKELGFIPLPFQVMQLPGFTRALVYGALLVPFVALHVLLAYGCGQDIDALIKAFTHSHGFIFSLKN
ncbi:MAG: hypothetical protein H0X46_04770 [Bacteroidetes bacterium]|nr:hypothetical protein [Bacteroidota bacterium]